MTQAKSSPDIARVWDYTTGETLEVEGCMYLAGFQIVQRKICTDFSELLNLDLSDPVSEKLYRDQLSYLWHFARGARLMAATRAHEDYLNEILAFTGGWA